MYRIINSWSSLRENSIVLAFVASFFFQKQKAQSCFVSKGREKMKRMRQQQQQQQPPPPQRHPSITLFFVIVTLVAFFLPKAASFTLRVVGHHRHRHYHHQLQQKNAALPPIVALQMTRTLDTEDINDDVNNDENINNDDDTMAQHQQRQQQHHQQHQHHHQPGRLEELKQREAELSAMLAAVRREKTIALQSRPLTIGVVGFGRFGQFIARTFSKYSGGGVVVTSRSDYSEVAKRSCMGGGGGGSSGSSGEGGGIIEYVPLSNPMAFLEHDLDVIVLAVSIMSFRETVQALVPYLQQDLERRRVAADTVVAGPLIVDVCSVKEHPRRILLDLLPVECDILCTHPMFGPDSGKHGWKNLNFVYEKTRVDQVLLGPEEQQQRGKITHHHAEDNKSNTERTSSETYIEGMDRMERFLSIWEEEGCRMVPMTCKEHDTYAANSQFVTHLIGRVLGSQGLVETPIDTIGFQSVLNLIDSTAADSFELFYGLYKYNQNSMDTIRQLQSALHDVVGKLHMTDIMNQEEKEKREVEEQERKVEGEQGKQESSILDQ